MIKKDLDILKTGDKNSLILFTLYKMQSIPEYSAISELAYLLDKKSLLNLCEYFGGCTIKIPTIAELDTVVNALVLYQQTKLENISFEQAALSMSQGTANMDEVKKAYVKICEVVNKYDFRRSGGN